MYVTNPQQANRLEITYRKKNTNKLDIVINLNSARHTPTFGS
jgi:hypothetical protein